MKKESKLLSESESDSSDSSGETSDEIDEEEEEDQVEDKPVGSNLSLLRIMLLWCSGIVWPSVKL